MKNNKVSKVELLENIRKPGGQALSLTMLVAIAYASLVFLFGADINDIYFALRIVIAIQFILAITSIVQFKDFFNYKNIDNLRVIKNTQNFILF